MKDSARDGEARAAGPPASFAAGSFPQDQTESKFRQTMAPRAARCYFDGGCSCWAPAAPGASFGTVVPIGGHASDIALDESRGVVYLVNFAASRIDMVSLANHKTGAF
jgi:hypothetical protein